MSGNMDINVVTTFAIFIIVNIGSTVWWASRTSQKVDTLSENVKVLNATIEEHRKTLQTKSEALIDIKRIEDQITTMWKRIDEISSMSLETKTKCSFLTGHLKLDIPKDFPHA
jgi:outer membrane murein-binding lipoprotein Lpp